MILAMIRGRRTTLTAAGGVLAVLAAAFTFRHDLNDWLIGYRFVWTPEGVEPRLGKSLNAAGELLVIEGDSDSDQRGGVWSSISGETIHFDPPLEAGGVAQPFAINERGHVVGAVRLGDQQQPNLPFLWTREGRMRMLPAPGEGDTWFNDINDGDQAVGYFEVGPPVFPRIIVFRAVFWTPQAGFHTLDGLTQEGGSQANSINESGWIAGLSIANDQKHHPVLWMPADYRPLDLGLLPGFDFGAAVDVNDRGTVLVNLWKETRAQGGNPYHLSTTPFTWTQERGFSELPVPQGYSVFGVAINQQDTVLLGAERPFGREAEVKTFLIRDGMLREIPCPPGASACAYHGLNNRGWLIGTARLSHRPDSLRGFVALPVR